MGEQVNPTGGSYLCAVYEFNSANEYIWNIKYLGCGEIDQDIDHHSWPFFQALFAQLLKLCV